MRGREVLRHEKIFSRFRLFICFNQTYFGGCVIDIVANEIGFPLQLTVKVSAPLWRQGYLQVNRLYPLPQPPT
jgi:hypothetical protein